MKIQLYIYYSFFHTVYKRILIDIVFQKKFTNLITYDYNTQWKDLNEDLNTFFITNQSMEEAIIDKKTFLI